MESDFHNQISAICERTKAMRSLVDRDIIEHLSCAVRRFMMNNSRFIKTIFFLEWNFSPREFLPTIDSISDDFPSAAGGNFRFLIATRTP